MRQPVPFGKYLLLDRISVGGMAEVFKAKSYGVEGFEKIIAIKRILPTMGEDRDFIKMFIDEAKIAGQLAHANICQIFELGRIDGSHFIAMEYIWGKDLLQIANRLRKVKQQMPIPMGCFAIAKVLEGLDYAHRKRDPLGRPLEIVHRDCSPQNVLVSYEGEVKVIDFGIAKATSRNSRTMAGVLKGKFGYMSPEQVRGLPLDRRSDIFAIGTMLYECLTGERLFQGETDFSTLEKVRNVDVQPPRAVNPAIPEAVEKIILKALAKDVEDRYQWCSEMLADLQAFLMGQDVVFTAKTLSQWLKETFAQEIERERQQLEQYKHMGRDGLIAGVPAADAKLDVVEHLGDAGAPEGDATVLGGPSFEDIEQAAGASPSVPVARSAPPASKPPPAEAKQPSTDDQWDAPTTAGELDDEDEDNGDFGEEAPTEIFGDEVEGAQPAAAAPPPVVGRSPTGNRPRPPTNAPPKPPPGARPMQPQQMPMAAQGGLAAQPMPSNLAPPPIGGMANQSGPFGAPQGSVPPPIAAGTPAAFPTEQPHMGGLAGAAPQPQKTVLGVQAPQGLGNYGSGGYRPSQPYPSQSQPGMPYGQQPYGYPQQGYPGMAPGMSGGMPGMHPGQMMPPAVAVDQMPPEGRKSTLVRDIGIGVAIAALVLVGFLVVKIFVLDSGDKSGSGSGSTAATSSLATLKLSLPKDVTVQVMVDGKVAASALRDKDEVPVQAGFRRVKLVGPNNQACDEPIKLEAGQTTTVECAMFTNAGSGSGSGAGSAPATGSGSATGSAAAATGSGSSGTAAVSTDVKSSSETKTAAVETTTTDLKAHDKTVKPADKVATTATTPKTETKMPPKNDTKDVKSDSRMKQPPPPPPEDAAGQGFLQVSSKPAAKILVDGKDTGRSTPISGHALPLTPGRHKITFVIGDDRFTYPVTIKAGQTETMSKDLQ